MPELSFNRLQLTDEEYCGSHIRKFGRFIARETILDEEYWVGFALLMCSLFDSISLLEFTFLKALQNFCLDVSIRMADSSMATSRSALGVSLLYAVGSACSVSRILAGLISYLPLPPAPQHLSYFSF